jgi:hypothetical protein
MRRAPWPRKLCRKRSACVARRRPGFSANRAPAGSIFRGACARRSWRQR